jgi:hypothetical protein
MTAKKTSPKKRKAPAHSALQTEVIKMIVKMDGINYPQAMKKLKPTMTKALGDTYENKKQKGMTYMEALQITKKYLQSKNK